MLFVCEIVRKASVRRVKARIMGILWPILSASFPEGMRESMLVSPLIPKRRAMRAGSRSRVFSA